MWYCLFLRGSNMFSYHLTKCTQQDITVDMSNTKDQTERSREGLGYYLRFVWFISVHHISFAPHVINIQSSTLKKIMLCCIYSFLFRQVVAQNNIWIHIYFLSILHINLKLYEDDFMMWQMLAEINLGKFIHHFFLVDNLFEYISMHYSKQVNDVHLLAEISGWILNTQSHWHVNVIWSSLNLWMLTISVHWEYFGGTFFMLKFQVMFTCIVSVKKSQ